MEEIIERVWVNETGFLIDYRKVFIMQEKQKAEGSEIEQKKDHS